MELCLTGAARAFESRLFGDPPSAAGKGVLASNVYDLRDVRLRFEPNTAGGYDVTRVGSVDAKLSRACAGRTSPRLPSSEENAMSLRAVAGILGGTILLAVFISWLDNRIDRRVEQGIESAVRAIVQAQRAEINRIRAVIAAEIAREQQD